MLKVREFTYMDWLLLPEDSNQRFELLNGRLIETASPTSTHQAILGELSYQLQTYLRHHRCGKVYFAPLDVFIEVNQIVVPDLIFIRSERLDLLSSRGLVGAPDFVVEVLSPSTRIRDLTEKTELYQRNFVETYWAIDPETREVLVFELGETTAKKFGIGQTLTVPCLPDFTLEVAALFEPFMFE
jgi:Uma2 family endonuclease